MDWVSQADYLHGGRQRSFCAILREESENYHRHADNKSLIKSFSIERQVSSQLVKTSPILSPRTKTPPQGGNSWTVKEEEEEELVVIIN